MSVYLTSSELTHHGVMGMKWGVRRYQPYGSGGYNPKSKGKFVGKKPKQEKPKPTHEELIRSTNARLLYEHRSELSDKELKDRLNRLENERKLKTFSEQERNENFRKANEILNKVDTIMKIKSLIKKSPTDAVLKKSIELVTKGAKLISDAFKDLTRKDEDKPENW